MSQLVISVSSDLPKELILDIIYNKKGLMSKTSIIITEYIQSYLDKNMCYVCKKSGSLTSIVKCPRNIINHRNLTEFQKYILEKQNPDNIWVCWDCAH